MKKETTEKIHPTIHKKFRLTVDITVSLGLLILITSELFEKKNPNLAEVLNMLVYTLFFISFIRCFTLVRFVKCPTCNGKTTTVKHTSVYMVNCPKCRINWNLRVRKGEPFTNRTHGW